MAAHLMRAQGAYKADKHATSTHAHTYKHPTHPHAHTHTHTHTTQNTIRPWQPAGIEPGYFFPEREKD